MEQIIPPYKVKSCWKCDRVLPLKKFFIDRSRTDGLDRKCRDCQNKLRAKRRFKTYGVTDKWFDEMMEIQGGRCAICNEKPKKDRRLCIDHDHATGIKRGLLCDGCNRGLGDFKDNPRSLEFAIIYLKVGGRTKAYRKKNWMETDSYVPETYYEAGYYAEML